MNRYRKYGGHYQRETFDESDYTVVSSRLFPLLAVLKSTTDSPDKFRELIRFLDPEQLRDTFVGYEGFCSMHRQWLIGEPSAKRRDGAKAHEQAKKSMSPGMLARVDRPDRNRLPLPAGKYDGPDPDWPSWARFHAQAGGDWMEFAEQYYTAREVHDTLQKLLRVFAKYHPQDQALVDEVLKWSQFWVTHDEQFSPDSGETYSHIARPRNEDPTPLG